MQHFRATRIFSTKSTKNTFSGYFHVNEKLSLKIVVALKITISISSFSVCPEHNTEIYKVYCIHYSIFMEDNK